MPATLSDGDALLADILAHPEDDVPRLIYADWLEDHGQAERAFHLRRMVRNPLETRMVAAGHRLPMQFGMEPLWVLDNPLYVGYVVWCRGFITTVCAPLVVLLDRLPVIVRQHPIERVEATGAEPRRISAIHHGWLEYDKYPDASDPDDLPSDVWLALSGHAPGNEVPWPASLGQYKWYRSPEAALDALSTALLTLARKEGRCLPR